MIYRTAKESFYAQKGATYYKHIRKDLVELVPEANNRVLDVGCGSGNTIRELKESGRSIEAIGIDILNVIEPENKQFIDHFICDDVEVALSGMQKSYFDVIICGDVLEHLFDPWATIKLTVDLLTDKGILLVSLPNIRFLQVSLPLLLLGRFNYANEGILDKTHLRFFTRSSAVKMLTEGGLKILELRNKMAGKWKIANSITFGMFRDLFTVQYIIKCTPRRKIIG